jgi:hypothetical protein
MYTNLFLSLDNPFVFHASSLLFVNIRVHSWLMFFFFQIYGFSVGARLTCFFRLLAKVALFASRIWK